MKISHGTNKKNIANHNGYGYATSKMIESLKKLGHEVTRNDASADVEIWFDQPHHWSFSKGVYRIGYHPWESTRLLPPGPQTLGHDWVKIMNGCDEIWTPSPIIAKWYRDFAGIIVPIYVYEHGVDPEWAPKPRMRDEKLRFLHVGGEGARKGAIDAMKALRLAFPGHKDVELNLKMIARGWKVGKIQRVNVLNELWPLDRLIELYHSNHVYVYPSWGEGFGLTPLQAMATGMPTITVGGWAPYERFLDPNLNVSSSFHPSPWPQLHPGNMLKPNMDDLIESMRYTYHNFDEVHETAQARVTEITEYYDWDKLTKKTFDDLAHRLQK